MTETSAPAENPIGGTSGPGSGFHIKSFSDYVAVFQRRWKLMVVAFVVVFLPGIFYAYSMPPMYRSTATFLIQQQTIRQDIVQTTVTGYTEEQIREVGQRVMSTSNLRPIIEKYNVFPDVNKTSIGEAIRELKRNTSYVPATAEVINPRTGRPMLATVTFDISFEYADPQTAQQVASELTDLYVKEYEGSRSDQVQATIDFLEADVDRNLVEVESTGQALADFRARQSSNLPAMGNYQFQLVERTERQIDALDDELREIRDRKIQLEGELRGLVPFGPTYDEDGNPIYGSGERLSELRRERLRLLSLYSAEHPDIVRIDREIEALSGTSGSGSTVYELQAQVDLSRSELLAARQRYSDDHPDVRQKTRELQTLETQLAQARQQPASIESTNPQVQQLQQLIDAAATDIRALSRRRSELVAKLEESESKIAQQPAIMREFTELTRDNGQALDRYNEALDKLDEARMAERLESGGSGQRFVLIGDPQVPSEPYQPIRTAVIILVVVLGTGAGIVLATIIDSLDSTVKSSRDILVITGAPALAVVPFLENLAERRMRTGKNVAVIGLLLASIAAAIAISQTSG
jgi:uncharacterized protein involved in exopolysaccharide biosynthesis